MPLVQSTRRVDPLDINKRVTIGVAFPLNEDNLTLGTLTTTEQLKANFLNLLLTVPGERINHPNYGIGLKGLLFENSLDEITLVESINNQVNFWMPEITVTDIVIDRDVDKYKISMQITYQILLNEEPDSIQINFS